MEELCGQQGGLSLKNKPQLVTQSMSVSWSGYVHILQTFSN